MLIRHSAAFTAGKLLPGVFGMATTALLTRLLDPAAYGLYGLSLVVMGFGSALWFDWLGVAYLRVAGDAPGAGGTVALLFAGLAGLAGAGAGAAWAVGWFVGPSGPALAAGLLLMGCYAAFELSARLPVARAQPWRFLLMNGARAGLSLAGAGLAAWLTHDPALTACGTAGGVACGLLLGSVPLPRGRPKTKQRLLPLPLLGEGRGEGASGTRSTGCPLPGPSPNPLPAGEGFARSTWSLFASWWPRFDPALARRLLRFGLPLAGSMALASLAGSGVRSLLDIAGSADALGVYTAAFLLVQNTLAVAAAGIASAGYPAAVRALARGDAEAAKRQLAANWSLLLAVLTPMALGMALVAPRIAAMLVGPRYVDGVAALTPWLAGAGLFAGLRAHGLDHVFQLADRPGRLAGVTAVAAVVAIGLTAALVPRFGANGAAMAAFASAACSGAVAFVWGHQLWAVPVPVGAAMRVGGACAIMTAAVLAVPGGLVPQVTAGVVGYAAGCVALDVFGSRVRLAAIFSPSPCGRGPGGGVPHAPGQPR